MYVISPELVMIFYELWLTCMRSCDLFIVALLQHNIRALIYASIIAYKQCFDGTAMRKKMNLM